MLIASYIMGWCLGGISLMMMFPVFYGLINGENAQAMAFMNSAVVLFFIAGSLVLALHRDQLTLTRRHQLLILIGIWFLLPLGAGLPYFLTGTVNSYSGAYFEAVSAYTTTGASLIENLTSVPRTIILWRALLQWTGGLTTLLMLSFIIGRIMGTELFGRDTRSIIQSNSGTSIDLENTFATILPLYFGLTLACYLLLLIAGIPTFDAFCLALSTLSTGGYMPREGSISLYGSPMAELVLACFMFFGAVSVIWVKALFERNRNILTRTSEPLWIAMAIMGLGVIFSLLFIAKINSPGVYTILHSITLGLASAASLVTTSGFIIGSPDEISLPYILLLLIALIGGGRYSTAGGIKFNRFLTMLDLTQRELKKLLYPHSIHRTFFGSEDRDQQVRSSVWSIFTIAVLFIVLIVMGLSYFGVPLDAALMLSVSSFSNFGPAYDMVKSAAPDAYPSIEAAGGKAQFLLCIAMIVGRVETLVLLGLLNLAIWRK